MNAYVIPGCKNLYTRQMFDESFNKERLARRIIVDISELLGVNIRTRTRKQIYVEGRRIASLIIVRHIGMPLSKVGELLTEKGDPSLDHTTIMHAIKAADNMLDTDKNAVRLFSPIINHYKDNNVKYCETVSYNSISNNINK